MGAITFDFDDNIQWARSGNLTKLNETCVLYKDKDTPFKILVLPNLIKQESKVQELREQVKKINLENKDNDLYMFQQSQDLVAGTNLLIDSKEKSEKGLEGVQSLSTIKQFVEQLQEQIVGKLRNITGINISNKHLDVTVSCYKTGNYLLCHNDDIQNKVGKHKRALAFVYYLVDKPWTQKNGGSLVLYDSDLNQEPIEINNKLYPYPNTLIVFETQKNSWHSVEEVLTSNDVRWSINGWFHVDNLEAPESKEVLSIEPCPYVFIRPSPLDEGTEKFLAEYINKDYLMTKVCRQIRLRFKEDSEINLTDFLIKSKYDEICSALESAAESSDNLKRIGPYNKRNYKVFKLDCLPQVCQDLYKSFTSELFFMMMAKFTGLELEPISLDNSKEGDEDEDDLLDDFEEADVQEEEIGNSNEDSDELPGALPDSNKRQYDQTASTSNSPPRKKVSKLSKDPFTRLEFQQVDHGSYSLVHDYSYELNEKSALDVVLHFNHDFKVDFKCGGYILYLAINKDDVNDREDELLTVEPQSNSLSLVYRTSDTCRFTKYVTSGQQSYQNLSCVFYESNNDLP